MFQNYDFDIKKILCFAAGKKARIMCFIVCNLFTVEKCLYTIFVGNTSENLYTFSGHNFSALYKLLM